MLDNPCKKHVVSADARTEMTRAQLEPKSSKHRRKTTNGATDEEGSEIQEEKNSSIWRRRGPSRRWFLSLRVMDLPFRTRRAVRASSKTSSAFSRALAGSSSAYGPRPGRRCSSDSSPRAAAAVQVRSHAGCGLEAFRSPH